ncbi:MAG: YidB family protein [bacterium]
MDMSDVLQIGAQLFQSKLDREGDGLDIGDIISALSTLLANKEGTGVDLNNIVGQMNSGDLLSMAASWLGNGENQRISSEQIANLFDTEKLLSFAQQLGLSEGQALNGLTEAIPNIVDKSSSDGSLLDMVGGISGAIGLASKLFSR